MAVGPALAAPTLHEHGEKNSNEIENYQHGYAQRGTWIENDKRGNAGYGIENDKRGYGREMESEKRGDAGYGLENDKRGYGREMESDNGV
jgi:hypothetical protein